MSTTTKTVTKDVEKLFKSLMPEEKARYRSGEWWRVFDEGGKGKKVTAQIADLETTVSRYIASMSAVDFIRYSQELYNLDTREWSARYFYSYLEGLGHQYRLISLFLIATEETRYYENQKYDIMKKDPEWKECHEISERSIAVLKERQRAIAKEIKDILASDFWEIRNIPRPEIELIPDPAYILGSSEG